MVSINYNLKEVYAHIEKLRNDGETWQNIADDLNKIHGVSFSESAWRKPYQAYKQGREDSINETELSYQMQEIRRKKKELSLERSINNQQIRDLSIHGVYRNLLSEALENLPSLSLSEVGKRQHRASSGDTRGTPMVFMADLHHDGDESNLQLIMSKVSANLIDYIENNNLSEVDVVELGDVIEGGSLRTSQLMAIKKGMVRQIVEAAEAYAQMLANVQRKTGCKINFHTVTSSNHTQIRPLNTKRNELMEEDLMLVFLDHLIVRFSGKEDKVSISGDRTLNINVAGFNVYCSHGHVGNMSPNNMSKVIYEEDFYRGNNGDFFVFGHYHHYHEESLNTSGNLNKKGFLMPSLSSHISDYEENLRLGSVGELTVLTFKENEGHIKTEHFKL